MLLEACEAHTEWPAQIAAGVCAGVDFALQQPEAVKALLAGAGEEGDRTNGYERLIGRLAGLIRARAPLNPELPPNTFEAMVAGVVGLVGDHVRIGRLDRLRELRPEMVLITLLPYLGFDEARRWADWASAS